MPTLSPFAALAAQQQQRRTPHRRTNNISRITRFYSREPFHLDLSLGSVVVNVGLRKTVVLSVPDPDLEAHWWSRGFGML